jgi:hypothetical protein
MKKVVTEVEPFSDDDSDDAIEPSPVQEKMPPQSSQVLVRQLPHERGEGGRIQT